MVGKSIVLNTLLISINTELRDIVHLAIHCIRYLTHLGLVLLDNNTLASFSHFVCYSPVTLGPPCVKSFLMFVAYTLS